MPRPIPRLHVVTDDGVVSDARFEARAFEVLRAGGSRVALHLRCRSLPARELHRLALALVRIAAETGSLVMINDRVDVATASGAGGVQLSGRSMVPNDARELVGTSVVIGASVHSMEQAERAIASGADFLLAGAVFPTASHPGVQPLGLDELARLTVLRVPVIGIGGITAPRVALVTGVGASGVAAIQAIWCETSPGGATARFLEALDRA